MPETNRRKYPRITISSSVDYVCLDDKHQEIEEGQGRILNISQGGALMETPEVINSKYIIIVTIDLEGNAIKLKGKVIHTRKSDPKGVAFTGIQFQEPYDTQREIIAKFIRAHYYKEKKA